MSFELEEPALRILWLGLEAQYCVAILRTSQAPRKIQRSSSGKLRSLDAYNCLSALLRRPYNVLEISRLAERFL